MGKYAALFIALTLAASAVLSAVPQRISYQGQYTVNGVLANGSFPFAWRLYATASGGSSLWSDTDTLVVTDGVFHAYLGANDPLPPSIFTGQLLWLETDVDGTMIPGRVPLVSVAYSFRSSYADTAQFALNASDGLWQTNGTNVWRQDGKVGIGTATPGQTLSVDGMFSLAPTTWVQPATQGAFLYHDGTGASFYAYDYTTSHANPIGLAGSEVAISTYTPAGLYDGVKMMIKSDGSVGVGTTTPAAKFDIRGGDLTEGGTGEQWIFHARSSAGGDFLHITDQDGGGDWKWNQGIVLHSNGNIGIGTQTPTARLDVAGAMKAATYYGDGSNLTGISGSDDWVTNGDLISHSGTATSGANLVAVMNNGTGRGIYASSNGVQNSPPEFCGAGIYGDALAGGGVGVYGRTQSPGVASGSSIGVFGFGQGGGVSIGGAALGVLGRVESYQNPSPGHAVPTGVFGEATSTSGVGAAWGIAGETWSPHVASAGVKGTLVRTNGALGRAIWGDARPASNPNAFAGYFDGKVHVTGTLTKPAGSFKIDHPLDPENKYLSHSFVESPDMMNVYNGNVVLDANGEATLTLPEWFEVLNKDFRYQLTAIGGPGPSLYVAKEVDGNTFSIAGGSPGLKVSWQVTGIRNDPYARTNRIQVEEEKPAHEKGKLMYPVEYGYPVSQRME